MTDVLPEGKTNFGADTLPLMSLGEYTVMSDEYYLALYTNEIVEVFAATDRETDGFLAMLAARLCEVPGSEWAFDHPNFLTEQAEKFYKKANDAISGSIATKIFMRARLAKMHKLSLLDFDNSDLDIPEAERRERIVRILNEQRDIPVEERLEVAATVEAYALEIETPIVEDAVMTRTEELDAMAAGAPRITTLASRAIDLVSRSPLGAIARYLEAPVDEEAELKKELARVL